MSAVVSRVCGRFRRPLIAAFVLSAPVLSLIGPFAAPARAASTETRVTSSSNPSTFGQSVTFRATVAGFGAGAPTGTVTFKNGAATLGSVAAETAGVDQPIALGDTHTCALAAGGVQCWGWNQEGQLGDGSTNSSSTPVPVSGLGSGVIALVAAFHTCALTTAGGVKCWGWNRDGQLGDGSTTDRSTPVPVSGLGSGVIALAAGRIHTCAVTAAGGVQCWGYNEYGQLGDGSNTHRLTPVPVSGLGSGVIALAAGFAHTCALTAAGGVRCWGLNGSGQLGDGSNTNRLTPVPVSGLGSGVVALAAGASHTCALTAAGGVQCWGYNISGQLGDGSTTSSSTPVPVSGLGSGVIALAAGDDQTCALTAAGGVQCWGYNDYGQIGDGSTTDRWTPVPVSGLGSFVIALAAGRAHTCALTAAGGMQCWGCNFYGQLGDGSTTDRSTPTDVSGFGAGVALVYAKASLSTAALSAGSHSITAEYGGGGGYDGSTSTALAQQVDAASTTTALGASPNPSALGQSVTLTATVSSGAGTPTGSVTFKDGATVLGTGTLSGNVATLATASLAAGTHTLTATYAGNSSFTASTSSGITQTVNKGVTTTLLNASPSPSAYGQSVTLTATIAGIAPAPGAPSGSVTFMNGGSTLGTGTLSGGLATFATASLAAGTHTITATYNGDSSFAVSMSSGLTQTVNQGGTSVSASASPNPSKPGQSVNLRATVTVTAPASGTPTGSVTFKEGSKTIGSDALSSGKVTVSTSALTIGTHTIAANYAGSQAFESSAANVSVTVDPKVGPEFRVNTATDMAQQFPAVTYLNNGNVIVTWASNAQDGSGTGIYAQRHNASGTRLGTEFQVNTATASDQTTPAIAALSNGGFVIVWASNKQDYNVWRKDPFTTLGIYGQRYTAAGAKTGAEFRINTTTIDDQSLPSVAGLKAGGFVVAWTSKNQDGSGLGIYAQRYDDAGRAAGSEFKVNTATADDQSAPAIAALTGGGFVVVWQSDAQDGSKLGIYGQRYDAVAKAAGKEFKVNATTAEDQSQPSVAGLSDGGFVVAWQSDEQDRSGLGIYAQRFTATGARPGTELLINTAVAGGQSQPSVAAFAEGGFIVMWMSKGQDSAAEQDIYAQAHKANGQKLDVEFRANTTTAKNQTQPSVAVNTGGSFVAVWTSRDQDGSLEGVYGQRFSMPSAAVANQPSVEAAQAVSAELAR